MELLPIVLNKKQRLSGGQSIIELLVAISIIVMVLLSLVSVASLSVRNSDYSKKKAQATQLSQQGLENIRALRDSMSDDWSTFVSTYTGRNWDLNATTVIPTIPCTNQPNISGIFIRCVTFELIPPSASPPYATAKVKVSVTVKWNDSVGTHISSATSQFTDKSIWQ